MKKLALLIAVVVLASLVAACVPATPQVVEKEVEATKIVEKEVEATKIVEKEVEATKIVEKVEIEGTIREGILEEMERARPREVFVYEVQPGDPSVWIGNLTELLDIKGEIEETEDLLFVRDGDRYLEIRKASSTAFYGDMAHLWTEEPSPEKTQFEVPGNEEAKEIALDSLKKFGFSDKDLETLEISTSDEEFEITVPGREEEPISVVVGKNVEVRRRIGDLLVHGPGSKIKFYIGSNGEVNGFMAAWRQIMPTSAVLGHKPAEGEPKGEKMTPISAEEAFEALTKNPLDHLPLALVYKIDIDRVDFGYYSRSAAEHQEYLQPVYVFYGTAYAKLPDGKEVNVPYEQYVVALEKPLEPIWPETRESKPEPRREGEVPPREEDVDEKGG
jgi:hypothetical protein